MSCLRVGSRPINDGLLYSVGVRPAIRPQPRPPRCPRPRPAFVDSTALVVAVVDLSSLVLP